MSAIPWLHWCCFSSNMWYSEDAEYWPLYVFFLYVSGEYYQLSMIRSQSLLPKSVLICFSVWSSATWNTPFQSLPLIQISMCTYTSLQCVYICIYCHIVSYCDIHVIIYIFTHIQHICGDANPFVFRQQKVRLLNELRVRLGGPKSWNPMVRPNRGPKPAVPRPPTLFPPCLLKSSIWAKFLRLAISLSRKQLQ